MNSSRKTECIMPDTGPTAPARTLVAVRAIVPVAQMPPNKGDATLAMPWATSSQFDRCRLPLIASATTAESSDSIPAKQCERKGVRQHGLDRLKRDVRQVRARQR